MRKIVAASGARWIERVARLQKAVGPVVVSTDSAVDSTRPLIAVTSSRLGHDPQLHRYVCQFLCRSLLESRQRNAFLLVASDSAIEPWAIRAAELFAVPVIKLSVQLRSESADLLVESAEGKKLSRDAVAIALADRVDAVYVRRGGTIQRCLRARVEDRRDASTRVAVSMTGKCAAPGLIASGAIGWFHARKNSDRDETFSGAEEQIENSYSADDAWTRTDGQWLIHSTRGCDGAWPDESERQYRDSILLGAQSASDRGPLDSLLRIVRSGRLVAAATATTKTHAVVCFSALPLGEFVQRRCFRPHLGRWDYEPYGIAIRLAVAKQMGIQPVIYGQRADRSMVSASDHFRFHPVGKTFDWREEREWRSSESVDLDSIDRDDVRVFAADHAGARSRLQDCRWRVTFLPSPPLSGQAGVSNAGKQV